MRIEKTTTCHLGLPVTKKPLVDFWRLRGKGLGSGDDCRRVMKNDPQFPFQEWSFFGLDTEHMCMYYVFYVQNLYTINFLRPAVAASPSESTSCQAA
jgi:hypothetical protein